MKNIILITGLTLLVINLVFYLLISYYDVEKFILSEINIGISLLMIYLLSQSKFDDAYKVYLSISFMLLGLFKFILSLFFAKPIQDNWIFLGILIITGIELLSFVGFKYFNRHS